PTVASTRRPSIGQPSSPGRRGAQAPYARALHQGTRPPWSSGTDGGVSGRGGVASGGVAASGDLGTGLLESTMISAAASTVTKPPMAQTFDIRSGPHSVS